MEVAHSNVEVVPSTIVEATEAQVFAVQSGVEEVTSTGEGQVAEGPAMTTEGEAVEKPVHGLQNVRQLQARPKLRFW